MRRSWIALVLGAVLLFAIGMAVGRQGDSPEAASPPRGTVTVTEAARAPRPAKTTDKPAGFARTREGAVSAAAAYVDSLDGRILLDPTALSRRISEIASSEAGTHVAAALPLN